MSERDEGVTRAGAATPAGIAIEPAQSIAQQNHHDPLPATTKAGHIGRRQSRLSVSKDFLATVAVAAIQAPIQSEFHATFGKLGMPMVATFLLSALTLFYMAFVQIFPTQVANFLMGTADLDDGDFWLLVEPPVPLVAISTLMLVCFGCCYVVLALFMVFFRDFALRGLKDSPPSDATTTPQGQASGERIPPERTETCAVLPPADRRLSSKRLKSLYRLRMLADVTGRRIAHGLVRNGAYRADKTIESSPTKPSSTTLMQKLLRPEGIYHAYYTALLDLPKLIFQTAALALYLRQGFPLPLTYFYLTMLMLNWLISFYRFQRKTVDTDLIVTRLFYLFDLFFAVFAPVVVVVFAYRQFDMDRAVFATREETLSPGFYDRIARLFADPVQIDVFRYGFMHLQFTKVWYVVGKICLNALVVFKWKKIITFLIIQRQIRKLEAQREVEGKDKPTPSDKQGIKVARHRTGSVLQRILRAHGKRRHLLFGIVVFLLSMVAILTYVIVAIVTSTQNCQNIPECRVISYQWNAGAINDKCPCIVFIDRDLAPRTWQSWLHATDVTQSLAAAAKSGHLRTVQIINRAVPELPLELSRCTSMEKLILIYSRTDTFPDWIGYFHYLHYLHIEADYVHYPIRHLPLDMFSHMTKLRFIRVGGAAALPIFPSLAGLHALNTLVLSIPHGLEELPSFEGLSRLSTLILADATHVKRLPSLRPLTSLKTFSLFRRNEMCCNGFITGSCDLSDYQCLSRPNEPTVVCETARMPEDDHLLLKRINGFVCNTNLTTDVIDSEPTELSTDGECGGVLYKQCRIGNRDGICYNGRMQVVRCDVFGEYITMRRLQIARGVGDRCDPTVEAWLGCTF